MGYPRTRHEAERDINSLFGWPEEYGDMDDASDDLVIAVAVSQYQSDEWAASTGKPAFWNTDGYLDGMYSRE